MKKSSVFLASVFILTLSVLASAPAVQAQPVAVSPVPLERFIVNNTNLGTLLTANYYEGVYANFAYYPFPQTAGIVLSPGAGYTPSPGQGLVPLYRWKVYQSGRWYYYYSTYYSTLGSGYYFEGMLGYVLPANGSYGGVNLQANYSQSKGYFFTLPGETIPGNTYNQFGFSYHGVTCNLPQGGTFYFDPPPPPPVCDPSENELNWCYNQGGYWDYDNCTCQVYYYY